MTSIARALSQAQELDSDSARLDVELLLGEVLTCGRSYLYTWPERELEPNQQQRFEQLLERRKNGEPIAYILGYREFWSLSLKVAPSTLIPRPATESLVELTLQQCSFTEAKGLDLGTGTGAIALALASERPQWQLLGIDQNTDAVQLAQHNQERLNIANASFQISNWFDAVSDHDFDFIVANPPYIDGEDPHLALGDLRFEPRSALVADKLGLADIKHIVATAALHLKSDGWLAIEHGYDQAAQVKALFVEQDFQQIICTHDLDGQPRITSGRTPT